MAIRVAVVATLLLAAAVTAAAGHAQQSPQLASPAEFARAVADARTVTINVHVPDDGSIPGTDRWIPFDRIAARRAQLPSRVDAARGLLPQRA